MQAFLYREGLMERIKAGGLAIFSRRPNALTQLDGMRAIAIIWVFALHTIVLSPHWGNCFD